MRENPVNLLSVDVEDAVNQAMRNFFNKDMAPTIRVYDNTHRLLDLFAEYETKGTFFILGEVAKVYPELIKAIADQGHELGIHGYSHTRYNRLSREELREEIRSSKHLVEDISGVQVLGHRAPEFSIGKENLWALDVLMEEGIKYDSSIFPANAGRYGWPGFTKNMDWLEVEDGRRILEVPLTTYQRFGREIPVGGGGYLRLFPFSFTRLAFENIQKKRPVNVYLHPYEIDPPPFQPFYMDAVGSASIRYKMKLRAYWANRRTVMSKLRRLLESYRFDTFESVIMDTMQTELRGKPLSDL